MCQITRKGSVSWKKGHRERVIRLTDKADQKAGKEVGMYLGFRTQKEEIKLSDLPKTIGHNDMILLINARADQIRTYRERNKRVPSFTEFIEKRNKKKIEKIMIKTGE